MPEAIQQSIQMGQFKRENAFLAALLLFVVGLGVAAITWYMVTINVNLKEIISSVNALNTQYKEQYKELSIKSNIAESNLLRFDSEFRNNDIRLNSLEKSDDLFRMELKNHTETLKRHDLLINDKRRKVNPL